MCQDTLICQLYRIYTGLDILLVMCHYRSMGTDINKKMVPIHVDQIRGLLKDCRLSRDSFARLRGVSVGAVHSWMRPDRNAIPEGDLKFLKTYFEEMQKLQFNGTDKPTKEQILSKIPPEIRRRGLYDPLNNLAEVEASPFSRPQSGSRSLTDGELVDELEKRGWVVTLTRKPK
jgi:DNA-binding transcriptional regulator YiaG